MPQSREPDDEQPPLAAPTGRREPAPFVPSPVPRTPGEVPPGTRAKKWFCFGLGFTGQALMRRLAAEGWAVGGTCRSTPQWQRLVEQGVAAFQFSSTQPLADPRAALAGTTHLLLSVPPDPAGDPVLNRHGADILALLSADAPAHPDRTTAPRLEWVGYLSTTGVYGDHGGGWVDETTAPAPGSARARARLMAEQGWTRLFQNHGLPLHIFRLPGIYGPGRSALDALRAGTARRVDLPGQVFSRIHVEDLATVLRASMARPDPGAIYNVCDDLPAPAHEVISFAASLLGVAPPPLVPLADADLSPMARSFYADNKKVRNHRIKQALGVTLAYPSYREGLIAQLAAGSTVDSF